MRTEEEIRTAIAKIIEHYESLQGTFPQHWLSMTYFNLGLLYAIGDVKTIPDILLPQSDTQKEKVQP